MVGEGVNGWGRCEWLGEGVKGWVSCEWLGKVLIVEEGVKGLGKV